MIYRSLAKFIGAVTDLTDLGMTGAYAQTPDLALSELKVPYCLTGPLREGAQELWAIGDAQRQENPLAEVAFYCANDEQARQFEARFRRAIESATATDVNSLTHPGINFIAFADRLVDAGDHKTYSSNQPGWFASPTPVVYKNGGAYVVDEEPSVIATGYTVDSTLGTVTFASANAAGDRIRATYKVGAIDFNIAGVARFEAAQRTDIANVPERYVVLFSLEAFYYIKTKANRWL